MVNKINRDKMEVKEDLIRMEETAKK